MPQTKLIYGVGRIPKASEFQLGEIIVNVDDSKIYSKNKSNVVFEVGSNSETSITDAFDKVSAFGSGFITAKDSSNNLIISGGSGIVISTGSNNDLIISSVGDPDSDWFIDVVNNRLTSSYDVFVQGDITASGVIKASGVTGFITADGANRMLTSNGDGTFTAEDRITFDSVAQDFTVQAQSIEMQAAGTGFDLTGNITASGDISAVGSVTASSGALIGDLRIVGDKIQPSVTSLTSFEIDGSDSRIQFNIGGAQYFKLDKTSGKSADFILGHPSISASYEFFSAEGNNTVALKISESKVGIGTTSPGERLEVIGNISASGLLFASASQPSAHAGSIVAVVYDTGSGRFYYTGSYGAGSSDDGDWFIDTNRLTSSLDVYTKGSITGSSLMITGALDANGAGLGINFDPQGDSPSGETIALRHMYGLDTDGDSKRLVFQRSPGGNYNTLFSQDSVEYMKFNHSGNLRRVLFNNFNPAAKQVNVEVMDSAGDISFHVSASGKTSIGSNTTSEATLTVRGNISGSGYLKLSSNNNTTGVAGALLYSSSNEYYLGFS